MEIEIKERLEEVVALLNDLEETVMEKEVKEKLEKILVLLNNPEEIQLGNQKIEEKLRKVVALIDNATLDPDIDIDYFIPGIEITLKTYDEFEEPYILVTYVVGEYTKPTRKIHLGKTILQSTAEEITNQVTFSIEEFKSEIDSVEMG